MGEEYEAAEDEEGGEEKPERWIKGKKKKKTVHAHVEAHIPLQLAPGPPKLDARGISDVRDWDPELLGSVRQR